MKKEINNILLDMQNCRIDVGEAANKLCDLFDVSNCAALKHEVENRRKQITDINQWTEILLAYRHKIRDRPLWAMIADINNRTTD